MAVPLWDCARRPGRTWTQIGYYCAAAFEDTPRRRVAVASDSSIRRRPASARAQAPILQTKASEAACAPGHQDGHQRWRCPGARGTYAPSVSSTVLLVCFRWRGGTVLPPDHGFELLLRVPLGGELGREAFNGACNYGVLRVRYNRETPSVLPQADSAGSRSRARASQGDDVRPAAMTSEPQTIVFFLSTIFTLFSTPLQP